MKINLVVAALLGLTKAGTASDDTYTNTLASCQQFAATFKNTCNTANAPTTLSATASLS